MGLISKIIALGATATAGIISVKSLKSNNEKNSQESKNLIHPTRNDEDYYNEDAVGIAKELSGAGFENIELKPIKKLGLFSSKRYGKIHNISINGNNKFSIQSHIVISYLDFKNNVDQCIYDEVQRIDSKNWRIAKNNEHIEISKPNEFEKYDSPQKSDRISKKYCSFCGAQAKNENAKFCTSCGNCIE